MLIVFFIFGIVIGSFLNVVIGTEPDGVYRENK